MIKVSYRFRATRDDVTGTLAMELPDGASVEIEAPQEMLDVIEAWSAWWERVGPAVHANN